MSQDNKKEKTRKIVSGRQMSRREIVEAVTSPDSVTILGKKPPKTIVISTDASIQADFEKVTRDMDVAHDSLMNKVVRSFCEEKKASDVNTKVFVMRIKNLSDEQLKIVWLLCTKKEFKATNILKAVQSIRKFDAGRLLSLRAFIELEGIGPGALNQFFTAALPQSNLGEVGREAYESEIREKMMTPAQNHVFYNICHQIKEIEPSESISVLCKVRNLKLQHAEVINTFLKKGAVFGDDPINSNNILKLINLWLTLPELRQKPRFKRLVKRLSRKFKEQPDFKYIAQSFIKEVVNEKSKSRFFSFILRIFS